MRSITTNRRLAAERTISMSKKVLEEISDYNDVKILANGELRDLEKLSPGKDMDHGKKQYTLAVPFVLKSEAIRTLCRAQGAVIPISIAFGSLHSICERYTDSIVICDINPIVPGGGFRIGDDSNESQMCRGSTLYTILSENSFLKKRYYCNNAVKNRWAQDMVMVVPNVVSFLSDDCLLSKLPRNLMDTSGIDLGADSIGRVLVDPSIGTRHTVLAITPPNMTTTSPQLKCSARTSSTFNKRVKDVMNVAACLDVGASQKLIVPVLGYKTFNIPAKLCMSILIDALDGYSARNIDEVIIVLDDETKVFRDYLISRLPYVSIYE